MSVEKLSNPYCSTVEKEESGGRNDQHGRNSAGQLRGLDLVGADRANEIAGAIDYAGALTGFVTPLRTFAPIKQRRRRPPGLKRRVASVEALRLAQMHKAVEHALKLFSRDGMPSPVERLVAAWETKAEATDYGEVRIINGPNGVEIRHDLPQVRPAAPPARAIDYATRVFELVLALKAIDPFGAYLVLARALPRKRVSWKVIQKVDPKRRARSLLVVLRSNALIKLLELADARGLSVDIFAVDKVDEKTA